MPPPIQQENTVVDTTVAVMKQMMIIVAAMFKSMQHNGGPYGHGYGCNRGCGRAFQYDKGVCVDMVNIHQGNIIMVAAIVPRMGIAPIPVHNVLRQDPTTM